MGGSRSREPARDGHGVLAALATLPGGAELLALAGTREDVALVGGAVRDLLLGREPRELDVVVGAEARELADDLASRLGGDTEDASEARGAALFNERFRTALVSWPGGQIDLATRRAESYPVPGALPEVREGTLDEDLRRRDVSVNAIAVPLGGERRGAIHAAEHAHEDLAGGLLRVLHERSFIDDPTRILRVARYRARLSFDIESHTEELAHAAIDGGALDTVSRGRIGAELRLALGEADPVSALASLDALGVLAAIGAEQLHLDASLAEAALALLPADGSRATLLMASMLAAASAAGPPPREAVVHALLDGFEYPAAERERIVRSALAAPRLAQELQHALTPSQLHAALVTQPPEAVALAGAVAGSGTAAWIAASEWLSKLRHVRLEIGGQDLLDAGIAPGPEIGRRLAAALRAKLDGELGDGREAELAAALAEDA